jgi:hypothetical protein
MLPPERSALPSYPCIQVSKHFKRSVLQTTSNHKSNIKHLPTSHSTDTLI